MTYEPYLFNILPTYRVCVWMWGTECLQSVPSSSMALQPIFGSGTPQCWGFQTIEFLCDKNVSPMPRKARESLFVWHLAQNLSSMGGPPAAMLQPALLSSINWTLIQKKNCLLNVLKVTTEKKHAVQTCAKPGLDTNEQYKRPLTTFHKPKYATDHEKWKVYFSSMQSPYILVHDWLHSDHWQLKVEQNSVSGVNCYTPTSQNLMSEKRC
jgi:hypothetical protein